MRFEFSGETIAINMPTRDALMGEVARRFREGRGFALATINLDHLATLPRSRDFLRAYAAQDLVVADGRPVVWLSHLAGRPVELMPGSDMIVPLCRLARDEGVRVALVGGTAPALDDAAGVLQAAAPGLEIAARIAPSAEFDPDGAEAGAILARLDRERIGLAFLALGGTRQERLAARGRDMAPGTGFASIGAGLDFLGGHQRRAPRWLRALALEWLWRLLSDPRRLGPRYLRCAAILPGQALAALRLRAGR